MTGAQFCPSPSAFTVSVRQLSLAWRLTRRELRSGFSGFRVFLTALAIGVAAIAAVGTVRAAVLASLSADARALLGGDIDLQLVQRPPTDDESAFLRQHTGALSQVIEMRAMARPPDRGDARTMVELKAVDAAYPLVGEVGLDPPAPLYEALGKRGELWGTVVEAGLLNKLGLARGEVVKVGEARFEIRATIAKEPDRVASVVSFGPRLMVAAEALPDTALVQPGSLTRYRSRVLLPDQVRSADWVAALKQAFPAAGWQARTTSEAAPGIQRFVERLGTFLTFAGLAALLIGGLGVGNAVKHHLDSKIETVATLKCIGASGDLIVQVYLLQIVVLALLGTALGVVLGAALPALALQALTVQLPFRLQAGVYPLPLLQAAALGLLTAATFALWPLGRAREVRAANLFRLSVSATGTSGRPRAIYAWATLACATGLASTTLITAHDRLFAAYFVGGSILTLLMLRLAASLVSRTAARFPGTRNAMVRIAMGRLRRPGAPTPMVMMSLGAGLTVLVAIALIDVNLRAQIGERLPGAVPSFFFIDIQDDQAAAFDETVAAVPGVSSSRRVPAFRGRIVTIGGVPVETAPIAPEAQWAVRGDRALTYAASAPEGARIVAGSWWPADYTGDPLVSLDAGLATGFGVSVGDRLTLNVLGRDIEVGIASLREIEWRTVPFDFALILTPGALQGAPHTHIAAVYADRAAEPMLDKAVADRFSNITSIHTREALESANQILARVGWSVRAAATVSLLAGILVLTGAIAADRRRRQYEAVLIKVLGATRARNFGIYLIEFAALGLVTAVIAAVLAVAVAWAVVVPLMQFDWTTRIDIVAGTIAVCTMSAVLAGFIGTWRDLSGSAAPLLREE